MLSVLFDFLEKDLRSLFLKEVVSERRLVTMVRGRIKMGEEAFLQQCEDESVLAQMQNCGCECCTTGLVYSELVRSSFFRYLI